MPGFLFTDSHGEKKRGAPLIRRGFPGGKKEEKMKRMNRRMAKRGKRHHKKHVSFLQAIRLYLGMPA